MALEIHQGLVTNSLALYQIGPVVKQGEATGDKVFLRGKGITRLPCPNDEGWGFL